MTLRYWISTSGFVWSRWNVKVCFIQFSSSRCEKISAEINEERKIANHVWEVFASMSSSRFLPGMCGSDGLNCTLLKVTEFECFDEVAELKVSLTVYNENMLHTNSKSCFCL